MPGAFGLPELEATSWRCAMEAFAEFYGDWSPYHRSYTWLPLSAAAEYFGLPIEAAHDVIGDCRMTLGVVKGMAESKPRK